MSREIITKKISGCDNCPMCFMNDAGPGYTCKLQAQIKTPQEARIDEHHTEWQPITPVWCPILRNDYVFEFEKS